MVWNLKLLTYTVCNLVPTADFEPLFQFLYTLEQGVIDNYAKDDEPGEVWLLCSFYHESLRSLIVKEVQ